MAYGYFTQSQNETGLVYCIGIFPCFPPPYDLYCVWNIRWDVLNIAAGYGQVQFDDNDAMVMLCAGFLEGALTQQ